MKIKQKRFYVIMSRTGDIYGVERLRRDALKVKGKHKGSIIKYK
ncbi:hypothetical protein LCGC14_1870260 [marine sediment metagenome]|uniref:Uncharacterized protein n=1 Tax=marine sediment metagenome TaxID=412755 RepID=A0A0F9IJ85_9ZZZZ